MKLPLIVWSICFCMVLRSFGLIGSPMKHSAPEDKVSCSISLFMSADITVVINQTHTKIGKCLLASSIETMRKNKLITNKSTTNVSENIAYQLVASNVIFFFYSTLTCDSWIISFSLQDFLTALLCFYIYVTFKRIISAYLTLAVIKR